MIISKKKAQCASNRCKDAFNRIKHQSLALTLAPTPQRRSAGEETDVSPFPAPPHWRPLAAMPVCFQNGGLLLETKVVFYGFAATKTPATQNFITWVFAAKDNCFSLVRPRQHGVPMDLQWINTHLRTPFTANLRGVSSDISG